MFKKQDDSPMKAVSLSSEKTLETTFLGVDALFKGELSFKGSLCIDGKFEGQIKTGGMLIVSETGDIEADIQAGVVVCRGKVRGNILASEKIEMHPKSKVIGDVKTPCLNIEIGAVLDGKCDMSQKLLNQCLWVLWSSKALQKRF